MAAPGREDAGRGYGHGPLPEGASPSNAKSGSVNLAASAVSGQSPPAGPQWVSRLAPLEPHALAYDKPLCASLDGIHVHRDRPVGVGLLQRDAHEAIRTLLHPLLRHRRAQHVVQQRLPTRRIESARPAACSVNHDITTS
jgi:hypothetical protein